MRVESGVIVWNLIIRSIDEQRYDLDFAIIYDFLSILRLCYSSVSSGESDASKKMEIRDQVLLNYHFSRTRQKRQHAKEVEESMVGYNPVRE